MRYVRDAKKQGVKLISAAAGITIVMFVLQTYVYEKLLDSNLGTILVWMVWAMATLAFFVFLINGFRMLRANGNWVITIDAYGIDWKSPNESIDQSFRLPLRDLASTETKTRRNDKGITISSKYLLVLTNGEKRKLSATSGINLREVIYDLESFGVPNTKD